MDQNTISLEKFNPTIAELQNTVKRSQEIVVTNLSDKTALKLVTDVRIELKNFRVAITKQGKEFRQQAIDFQKAVISKEKELIAIIEPEETRLELIEKQAEELKEKTERLALLPERKEKLALIGDSVVIDDEKILEMDSVAFQSYCNQRVADKNTADRLALEARQNAIREAEAKLAHEQEIKEAEERARIEERKKLEEAEIRLKEERLRAEQEAKERIEKLEREAKEKAERLEREAKEKVEAEERARIQKTENEAKMFAEKKVRLEKDKKYQDFLREHEYTAETADQFHFEVLGSVHILYKKIGEISL